MSSPVCEKSNTGPQSKPGSSLQRTTSTPGGKIGSSRLRTEAPSEASRTSSGVRRALGFVGARVTSSTQTRSPARATAAAPERGTFSATPASTCVTGRGVRRERPAGRSRAGQPRRRAGRGCSRGRGAPPGRWRGRSWRPDRDREVLEVVRRHPVGDEPAQPVGREEVRPPPGHVDDDASAAAAQGLLAHLEPLPASSSMPSALGCEPRKQALIAPTDPPTSTSGVTPAAHRVAQHPHSGRRRGNRRRGRRCCVGWTWRESYPG